MRQRRNRLGLIFAVWLALVSAISGVSLAPNAAQAAVQPSLRVLENFGSVRSLAVAESANRLVVVRWATVDVYRLDSLQLVGSVSEVPQGIDPRIEGDSVFVAASNGGISEISLEDGSLLHRWPTNQAGLTSIDVSAELVWFVWRTDGYTSMVGRIDRATGVVDRLDFDDDVHFGRMIRVRPSHPEELYLGSTQIASTYSRYRVEGSTVSRLATSRHGDIGGGVEGLEFSPDGQRIWMVARHKDWLMSFDAGTLEIGRLRYDGLDQSHRLAVERTTGSLIVMGNRSFRTDKVLLFDSDVPTARNSFTFEGSLLDIGVSTSQVFAATSDGSKTSLYVWALDYDAPEGQFAPGTPATGADGFRSLMGLNFEVVTDLLVSEEHNRVLIAGDDRVEIYSLGSLAHVQTVDGIYGVSSLQLRGDSVFVAGGNDGVVTEFAIADGSIRDRWVIEVPKLSNVDVTDEYIWFTHHTNLANSTIGRLSRATGLVEEFLTHNQEGNESVIRASPTNSNEFVLWEAYGSGIKRFGVEGEQALLVVQAPHGSSGRGGFVMSDDGSRVWSGRPNQSLVELDGASLQPTSPTYAGSMYVDRVAVEPTVNELFAVAGIVDNVGTIWLYDDGEAVARNEFNVYWATHALAVSTTEVFAVSGSAGRMNLDIWALDYVDSSRQVTVTVEGHGQPRAAVTSVRFICGDFRTTVEVDFAQTYSVTVPAGLRNCHFSFLSGGVTHRTFFGTSTGSGWNVEDGTELRFDPGVDASVIVYVIYESPVSSLDLFIKQSFADVVGRQPTQEEWWTAGNAIFEERQTVPGFVVDLMNDKGRYEHSQAPIARLYRAYFLRDSDRAGIAYWVDVESGGSSLRDISEYFADSEEFKLRYGTLDDAGFIELVYQNVMGRQPDPDGYAYWLDQMNRGMTRGDLMIYFSDSPEYRNYVSDRVFVLYAARVLELRDPSEDDIQYLLGKFRDGGRDLVVQTILEGSPYSDRFWIGREPTAGVGLRASELEVSSTVCPECLPPLITEAIAGSKNTFDRSWPVLD